MAGRMGSGKAIHTALMGIKEYEPPSEIHVNLKKHTGMNGGDVGSKIKFSGHGKITAIHKDGSGHRMHIEIHKIAPELP